jgi:hypothetical protein
MTDLSSLEAEHALQLARKCIAADRAVLFDSHVNQHTGRVEDPRELRRIAEYDKAMAAIDAAVNMPARVAPARAVQQRRRQELHAAPPARADRRPRAAARDRPRGRIRDAATEGEFATLRERFDYIVCAPQRRRRGGHAADRAALARALWKAGTSAILDIYELKAHERVLFVRRFLEALTTRRARSGTRRWS